MMEDFAVNDPGFLEFVNQQLRGPSYDQRQKKPAAKPVPKHVQEPPRNYDESVDYDGIFKLVNKQTFELVITRYLDNHPEGPQPPDELMEPGHQFLMSDEPHFNFITQQLDDE